MRFKVQTPIRIVQRHVEIPKTGVRIVVLAETRTGGLTPRGLKMGIAYGDVKSHLTHDRKLLTEFDLQPNALADLRHGWVVIHATQYPNRLLLGPIIGKDMGHINGNPHPKTKLKIALLRRMLIEEVGIPEEKIPPIHLSTTDQDSVPLHNHQTLEEIRDLATHQYATLIQWLSHSH